MPRWSLALLAGLLAAPAFAQKDPADALASMTAGDGLKVELFAAEPLLVNPTSIDVDHKGRVWVAEAVNYRRKNFGRPILRKEGDRIVVLTDTDGDGKADESTVFYQGEDLYGPLSVLVIPTGKSLRVLVAQSPDILEFTCKDADNPVADGPPKKFLTGFQGFDHDHGVHGLHLGPDGKLYFTVGDSGVKDLQSSDGKGRKWTTNDKDVQKGTVWRCDLDGKNLELIAHNFRNNYEACVDSFGEIWLSDNDDDGNQQTRICFVFPGGNYGYGPRGPGQSHWHEEQPGIVHKTLRTGFGSPTGIQFYEGSLLPKLYANTLLHCDAGPREVRAFTRKPKGAGYELDKAVILTSSDNWFRPSDVCTAPDGSVFVADWYDPGVGGHGMGDWTRGRIYRLTPKDHKGYKVPEVKLDTKEGVLEQFGSPCLASRMLALNHINGMKTDDALKVLAMGVFAEEGLTAIRSHWHLGMMGLKISPKQRPAEATDAYLRFLLGAIKDPKWHPYLERQNRELAGVTSKMVPVTEKTTAENAAKIAINGQREALIGMRNEPAEDMKEWFYARAKLYDGSDIFYRAALNIACGTDPERRDKILADFDKHFPEWNEKVADLVWELRPKGYLAKISDKLYDRTMLADPKRKLMDVIGSSDDPADVLKLLAYYRHPDSDPFDRRHAFDVFRQQLGRSAKLKDDPAVLDFITSSLRRRENSRTAAKDAEDRTNAIQLAAVVQSPKLLPSVRSIATDGTDKDQGNAIAALGSFKSADAVKTLETLVRNDVRASELAMKSLGKMQSAEAVAVLRGIFADDKASEFLRGEALNGLVGSKDGTAYLLKLKEDGKFPETLEKDAGRLLRNSPFQGERNKAMILFPPAGKLDPKKLPAAGVLATKKGNAENGKALMAKSLTGEAQCLKCHTVRGTGGSIGPDLSMIGKKASKENLYDSLLTPSKAIADQYVSWRLDGDDGQTVIGLLVEENAKTITVRDANGKDHTFDAKEVTKKKDAKSIMPEDVIKAFTEDELIDVVEYLTTLQTPSLTPDSWHLAGPFPAKGDQDLDAKFDPETKPAGDVTWKTVRGDAKGYFDLHAAHGKESANSVSYLHRVVESPADQEVTILLGTDDGCRLWVNGEKVFGHERHDAATPARDAVKVKLKKGANTLLLKINNGDNPHGFYLTLEGGTDLKLGR